MPILGGFAPCCQYGACYWQPRPCADAAPQPLAARDLHVGGRAGRADGFCCPYACGMAAVSAARRPVGADPHRPCAAAGGCFRPCILVCGGSLWPCAAAFLPDGVLMPRRSFLFTICITLLALLHFCGFLTPRAPLRVLCGRGSAAAQSVCLLFSFGDPSPKRPPLFVAGECGPKRAAASLRPHRHIRFAASFSAQRGGMAAAVRSAKKVSDDNLEKRLTFHMLNIIMHMVSPDRLLKGNKKTPFSGTVCRGACSRCGPHIYPRLELLFR